MSHGGMPFLRSFSSKKLQNNKKPHKTKTKCGFVLTLYFIYDRLKPTKTHKIFFKNNILNKHHNCTPHKIKGAWLQC